MKRAKLRASGDPWTTKAIVGPVVLALGASMTVAVVHDFIQFSKDALFALAVCAPVAYLIVRWFMPWVSQRLLDAPRPAAAPAAYPSDTAAGQTP